MKFCKILNGYENIDLNVFSHLINIVEHEVTLVKDQCRLDIRKDSFSQWNILSTGCLNASSVNVIRIFFTDNSDENFFDSRSANGFLSICHLGLLL